MATAKKTRPSSAVAEIVQATERARKRAPRPRRVDVYYDEAGQWRWRQIAANGNNTANSGQSFPTRRDARRAAERTFAGDYAVTLRVFDAAGLVESTETIR